MVASNINIKIKVWIRLIWLLTVVNSCKRGNKPSGTIKNEHLGCIFQALKWDLRFVTWGVTFESPSSVNIMKTAGFLSITEPNLPP